MEYTFFSESSVLVGTMDHSPHSSGFSYKYDVKMQVHGDSIKVAFNGKHEAGQHPFDQTNFIEVGRDIPPYEIKLDEHGLFSSLTLDPKLSINQRNIVKAFAQHQGSWTWIYKRGECQTLYSVTGDKIVKSVTHTKDCKNRVNVLVDDWRGYRCHIDPENPESRENPNGLYSASNTVMMVERKGDRFLPKAIVGSSSVVAQFFGDEGVSFVAHSNSPGDIVVNGETITDLRYEFEDKDYTWKNDRDLKTREFFEDEMPNLTEFVKKRLSKQSYIFNEMSDEKAYLSQAHYYGLNNIYPAMVEMDYNALKVNLRADKSEEGIRKNNLFNELLGSLGTSSATILIRDMIMENKFDNYRDVVRILTSVPFHIRHPNHQLIKELEVLYDYNGNQIVKDSVPLVIGHLARVTCERAGVPGSPASNECYSTIVDDYTERTLQKILGTSDHNEQLSQIMMLFNLKYGKLADKLKPLIYGETKVKCGHLRSLALQAAVWSAVSSGKGPEYLLPIFAETENSHELRITALSYIMGANPSSTHFNAILAVLYKEKDFEVVNFAFTLFETYAKNIDPCRSKVATLAKYFLKYLK
ncbi:Putative LOC100868636, partial [Caligus rogercresseyi]